MTASSKSLKQSSNRSLKQPSSKSLGLPSTKSMSQTSSKAISQTASHTLDLPSCKSLGASSNKSLSRKSGGKPKKRGKSSSRRHSKYPVRQTLLYVLLDALLPFFDLVSDGAVCVLLFLAGHHALGILTAVCMLGPHLAVTYLQTMKCWMAVRNCVEHPHCWIPEMDEGVWRVPHRLVKKLTRQEGVGDGCTGIDNAGSPSWNGARKPMVVLKLVVCSLCSLPVILPYLLSQDAVAMATVSKHKRWGGRRKRGTVSHARKSGSEGWLFKRRFLELFFQSPPQLLVQIATVLVLNNNSAVWGVTLGSVWGLSVGLTVCSTVSNMMLVLNFKRATGMSMTDMLWFAVDHPGVVLRSSDTIMYLYRDRCRRLEIDVDNAEFVTFWGGLLELIRTQDLTNLTVVHVSSSGGEDIEKQAGVRSDLRSLFEAVNQKEKSHVAEIQVDLSVFGGFVQV